MLPSAHSLLNCLIYEGIGHLHVIGVFITYSDALVLQLS